MVWWVFSVAISVPGHQLNHNDDFKRLNTLRPRQNGCLFADDIFKRIFNNENVWISMKFLQKFVTKSPINNIPALVQIMAWRRPGDKPLSEPMMVSLTFMFLSWYYQSLLHCNIMVMYSSCFTDHIIKSETQIDLNTYVLKIYGADSIYNIWYRPLLCCVLSWLVNRTFSISVICQVWRTCALKIFHLGIPWIFEHKIYVFGFVVQKKICSLT